MRKMMLLCSLAALMGCKGVDGTETNDDSRSTIESSTVEIKESVCKVRWITSMSDYETASRVGLDMEKTYFVIHHDSLELREGSVESFGDSLVLSSVDVVFGEPMITDFTFSVIEGKDTVNSELWLSVPLKDGGTVDIVQPLTCKITFDITIDPNFKGDYDVD